MRDRILQGLALDDKNDLFDDLLESSGDAEAQMLRFLHESPRGDDAAGSKLYFWEETRELEREILIKVERIWRHFDDGTNAETETVVEKFLEFDRELYEVKEEEEEEEEEIPVEVPPPRTPRKKGRKGKKGRGGKKGKKGKKKNKNQ